jgi:phage tail-like protein
MPIYGEPLYGEGADNTDYFLGLLVETQPPPYRPEEYRDFLGRFLLPSAEDLSRVNQAFDLLDTFVYPESAPEEWVEWMLAEWWGWTLIPQGYPLARKRRLLSNLHRHYKRRYTVTGIRELLREFGIVAEVYDRPLFVRGFTGSRGSQWPLKVRVFIHGYEAFFFPQRVFIGNFVGGHGLTAAKTRQMITEQFVLELVRWSRAAGAEFLVEWKTGRQALVRDAAINDDDEVMII